MRVLFLDDMEDRHQAFLKTAQRTPHCTTVCCWTAAQAIRQLDTDERFDAAFLDHDLVPEHYEGEVVGEEARALSGMAVAEHIAEMPEARRPRQVIVHSFNGPAANRMVVTLREAGVRCERLVFTPHWWKVPRI